ncbi:hypothetical protein IFM89_007881 [Coptis chinensis]|uniref:Uncharacterized protein n=1 Tax=Coptis chinensis TaxID=261450 RepID=A0A835LLT3_9MAGN|nr:hypothetical protein IFM89_007881 [Coptis chinensis]
MPTRHLPPTTPLPAEDMAGETRPLTEAEPPLSSRHYHPLLGYSVPTLRSLQSWKYVQLRGGEDDMGFLWSIGQGDQPHELLGISLDCHFILWRDSLTHDPVLSFKMGKQEVLRKWSSSLNAYLELVFRDNKLMKMPDVSIFKSLLVFDVSYNEIPSLNGVSKVSSTLKELHVSKNEVTKMEELDHLYNLHILKLGSNRLRLHVEFYPFPGLCCIGCHNGISKMEGLSTLVNLRILDISSNKLTVVDDIEKLTRQIFPNYMKTTRQFFPNLGKLILIHSHKTILATITTYAYISLVLRRLSAYSKVPPKLEVCSTKSDFEESETVGKNVMEVLLDSPSSNST